MKKKFKSMMEILIEHIRIEKGGFSGEQQICGIFRAVEFLKKEGYIHKSEKAEKK